MCRSTSSSSTVPSRLPFVSYAAGAAHTISMENGIVLVHDMDNHDDSQWHYRQTQTGTVVEWADGKAPCISHTLAMLDALIGWEPAASILLQGLPAALSTELAYAGIVLSQKNGDRVCSDMLWQHASLWLPQVHAPIALRYALTAGKRHPLRPPKSDGPLYRRFIPWLNKTFSFRSIDPQTDLPMFNRWMNDPEVAEIWQEEGDMAQHAAYLAAINCDPHMQSMIASFDGVPFAYFEIYWARESRIAPFYDVGDYDRGWHVLVGEAAFRGKTFATAWLTSISHYIFLCDPRTQRAVGEPRNDHHQQIRNLDRSGYAKIKEFDLPHKRALLVMLLRERYFTDSLWLPRTDSDTASQRNTTNATTATTALTPHRISDSSL